MADDNTQDVPAVETGDTPAEEPTAAPAKKAAKKAPAKRAPAKKAAAKKAAASADALPGTDVTPVAEPGEPAATDTAVADADQAKPAKKAATKKAAAKKAPAKKAAAKKTTKKAAAAVEAAEPAGSAEGEDGADHGVMPLFQVPEKVVPAKRTRTRKAAVPPPVEEPPAVEAAESAELDEDDEDEVDTEAAWDALEAAADGTVPAVRSDETTATDTTTGATGESSDDGDESDSDDESDDESDESDDEASGDTGPRRRRRRGGRRRRRSGSGEGGDTDADTTDGDEPTGDRARGGRGAQQDQGTDKTDKTEQGDKTDGADGAEGTDTESGEGEGGTSSTRRRRKRRREGDDGGSDEPGTTTRVRRPRNAEDEITSIQGSTRLEAKKQRRRDGREAGRRRAPIVSEAEFLARRESVDRVMVVRQRDELTQIGVLEDKILVEHYVARESQTSLIGNIYLGRVQNVLPSMEAAFIDIGKGRNAVIYAGEVNWSQLGHKDGQPRKIESVLSSGQTILVQVSKDPVGHKGARLTSQISLAGRFLVYVPDGTTSGISRKLPDTERNRLKTLLKEVVPSTAGVIVRTAAEGASEEELTQDVERLKARWEEIETKAKSKNGNPQLLHGEPDLTLKVVRDLFTEDFAQLVIQGDDAWDLVHGYVEGMAPDLLDRVEKYDPSEHNGVDLFSTYRIDEQIAKAVDRKVFLPSGGSLVIDRTEAMTVVDVNTGKFTGSGGNLEETVTKNNLEAAEEVVRQLRLRDIGGIIVIDFIDMVLEANRDLVLRRMVECLGRDRTRHQVAEVTSLGLVQMTRKRIGTGLIEAFSETCDHCQGRGVIIHDLPVEPKRSADDGGHGGSGRSGGRGNGGGNANGGGNSNSNSNNGGGGGGAAGGEAADGERRGRRRGGRGRGDDAPATPATRRRARRLGPQADAGGVRRDGQGRDPQGGARGPRRRRGPRRGRADGGGVRADGRDRRAGTRVARPAGRARRAGRPGRAQGHHQDPSRRQPLGDHDGAGGARRGRRPGRRSGRGSRGRARAAEGVTRTRGGVRRTAVAAEPADGVHRADRAHRAGRRRRRRGRGRRRVGPARADQAQGRPPQALRRLRGG